MLNKQKKHFTLGSLSLKIAYFISDLFISHEILSQISKSQVISQLNNNNNNVRLQFI